MQLPRRALLASAVGAALLRAAPSFAQHGRRTFRGRAEDEWLRELATRPVTRMVSRHSSTAIVFCLDLGDGFQTAFKPERPGQESWWRHEIVSYRFAKLLGIDDRVPPTVGRTVPATIFGRFAASDRLITQPDGMVRGSASVWMPTLRGEQLHTPDARREWSGWLVPGAAIPAARNERARQIAQLLVLDWIMANYDRWNCCNIPVDERAQLVFRDNDAGWFPRVMNRVNAPDAIRRLPRSMWERLRGLDTAAFRAEVERDPMASVGLMGRAEYAAYERRRARLIEHIEALLRRHGEAAVLAWP